MFANEDGHQICSHVSFFWLVVASLSVMPRRNTPHLARFSCSAEPGTNDIDQVLREIYILYTDCALKDPFYELEMPIRSTLFTKAVDALMERLEKAASTPSKR